MHVQRVQVLSLSAQVLTEVEAGRETGEERLESQMKVSILAYSRKQCR
jgi:hypothetical protein